MTPADIRIDGIPVRTTAHAALVATLTAGGGDLAFSADGIISRGIDDKRAEWRPRRAPRPLRRRATASRRLASAAVLAGSAGAFPNRMFHLSEKRKIRRMGPRDAQLHEDIDTLITMIDTALRTHASHRLLHALAYVLGDRRRRLAELGCIE